jgi:hypothetical protein
MRKSRAPRPRDRVFIIPDVHTPYHDEQALECALRALEGWRPTKVVVLGDFVDFACVSTYVKDPRRVAPLAVEIAAANAALDRIDAACKRAGCRDKTFLLGNHEVRLELYIMRSAPELVGHVQSVEHMLSLHRRPGWTVVPYKRAVQIGHMRLSHDFGRAGVNAARQAVLDVGESAVFGHTHRLSVHYQGTVAGRRLVGATLGWLGDPEAIDYRHQDLVRRDSQHGFGVAHVLDGGLFWLQAIPIVEGRAVVDGTLY